MRKNIGKLKLFLTKIIPFIPLANEVIIKLDVIITTDEAKKAHEEAPFFGRRKIRKIIDPIWDKLSFVEIDTIGDDAYRARRVHNNCRSGSNPQKLTITIWDGISDTQIRAATNVDQARRANNDSRPGSKAEKDSVIKWDELSLKQVSDANTIDEIKRASVYSRPGSKAEKDSHPKQDKILLKLISEAKTVTEVQVISRNYLPFGNEKIKEAANKKIQELSKNKDY